MKRIFGKLWFFVNLLVMGFYIRRFSGWKWFKSFFILIWESFLENIIIFFFSFGNVGCYVLFDFFYVFSFKCDIMILLSEFFLINWLRVNIIEFNCFIFWRVCFLIFVLLFWGKWILNRIEYFVCWLIFLFYIILCIFSYILE